MNKTLQRFSRPFRRQVEVAAGPAASEPQSKLRILAPDIDWEPDEALSDYFRVNPSVTLLENLRIDSPALERLKQAGFKLVMPLVSQGELIGMLNLGSRLSEQDYSSDDIALLNNLAAQATPAVRVAQLVREQQEEAKERERMEQELRVARLIQQTLLPKELPDPEGWSVQAYYQPARAVGGDFYDFIQLPDNRLGIFVGDVTDKGVPAALVMATTRRILRFAATARPCTDPLDGTSEPASPGKVLAQANDLLCPDIPANMFVTCLYAVLDLSSGRLSYANAGHNPPYCYGNERSVELRARGMPLGLMPAMQYEELETVVEAGERLLIYSDGVTEAHNPSREMFGFERLQALVGDSTVGVQSDSKRDFIRILLDEMEAFTGSGWEQEDDVSVVILSRLLEAGSGAVISQETEGRMGNPGGEKGGASRKLAGGSESHGQHVGPSADQTPAENQARRLAAFEIPSEPGNERQAMRQVAEAVSPLELDLRALERLKTAVAETTMNAIEHGNQFQPELMVEIEVWATERNISVIVRDHGGGQPIQQAGEPDLAAKLAGEQSPRGWGLFLIEKMVDEMTIHSDETHHIVELVIDLKGTRNHDESSRVGQ